MARWSVVYAVLAIGIGVVLVATAAVPRLDRSFTRLCLATFRDPVASTDRRHGTRLLQSLHSSTSPRVFAARTVGYAVGLGAIAGLLAAGTLSALPIEPPHESVAWLLPPAAVVVVAATGATATLRGRRWLLRRRVARRRVRIDESLPRTVAFVYALSRGGMVLPQVMRTVACNRPAFGESAAEIGVLVADMDRSGADLGAALDRAAKRSPSEQFADFADNVAGVLRSGRNVPAYLREQYDFFRELRVDDQERLLAVLAAIGEGYVAVLVAGPLFVLTILLVFGVLTGGLIDGIRVVVYVVLPIATLVFGGYVHATFRPLTPDGLRVGEGAWAAPPARGEIDGGRSCVGATGADSTVDGGRFPTPGRLDRARDRLAGVVPRAPALVLVAAVLLAAGRLWRLGRAESLNVSLADDVVIQSALVALVAFAVVREGRDRRRRSIEAAMPDFLARLAAANEAGLPLTRSLRRTDRSDLGPLDVEVRRLVADVEWGGRTERALERFAGRTRSPTVGRIVALLTNAMTASGTLAPVLRIAADEARQVRRLRRARRRETFVYRLVIYLSFLVFLGIGVAVQTVLVPAIPAAPELAGSGTGLAGGGVTRLTAGRGTPEDAYVLLLHHAAFVQAVCSGFVAGLVGEGDLGNGAKHVAAMLLLAYGLLGLIG